MGLYVFMVCGTVMRIFFLKLGMVGLSVGQRDNGVGWHVRDDGCGTSSMPRWTAAMRFDSGGRGVAVVGSKKNFT